MKQSEINSYTFYYISGIEHCDSFYPFAHIKSIKFVSGFGTSRIEINKDFVDTSTMSFDEARKLYKEMLDKLDDYYIRKLPQDNYRFSRSPPIYLDNYSPVRPPSSDVSLGSSHE